MSAKPGLETARNPLAGAGYAAMVVLCWASYNVAAKAGIDGAFRPQDISTFRFSVAGLLFAPLVFGRYSTYWSTLSLWRILVLAGLSGPVFGLVAVGGFSFAPLSHRMLFAPSAAMTVGTLLSWAYGGSPLSPQRLAGMLIMVSGLLVLVGFEMGEAGPRLLLGEAMFLAAGSMWGGFTFLLGRWNLDALATTCVVGATSGLLALPVYLLTWSGSLPDVTLTQAGFQAFMQGILGGGVGVFALVKSTEHLGAARASLLPILTPAAAMILSALFIGTTPSAGEVWGALIVSAGLLAAMRG